MDCFENEISPKYVIGLISLGISFFSSAACRAFKAYIVYAIVIRLKRRKIPANEPSAIRSVSSSAPGLYIHFKETFRHEYRKSHLHTSA